MKKRRRISCHETLEMQRSLTKRRQTKVKNSGKKMAGKIEVTWPLAFAAGISRNGGCFPLCQRFRKFRSEFKWKGPFRFLPTGIFGITFGGGPLISVGIFRSKFAVPFLTNRFFALIRKFGNVTKWQELFLIGWRGLIGKCRSIFLG